MHNAIGNIGLPLAITPHPSSSSEDPMVRGDIQYTPSTPAPPPLPHAHMTLLSNHIEFQNAPFKIGRYCSVKIFHFERIKKAKNMALHQAGRQAGALVACFSQAGV